MHTGRPAASQHASLQEMPSPWSVSLTFTIVYDVTLMALTLPLIPRTHMRREPNSAPSKMVSRAPPPVCVTHAPRRVLRRRRCDFAVDMDTGAVRLCWYACGTITGRATNPRCDQSRSNLHAPSVECPVLHGDVRSDPEPLPAGQSCWLRDPYAHVDGRLAPILLLSHASQAAVAAGKAASIASKSRCEIGFGLASGPSSRSHRPSPHGHGSWFPSSHSLRRRGSRRQPGRAQ